MDYLYTRIDECSAEHAEILLDSAYDKFIGYRNKRYNESILSKAIDYNKEMSFTIVQKLRRGSARNYVNDLSYKSHKSPLLFSILEERITMVEKLLFLGAYPNQASGITLVHPMHAAAAVKSTNIIYLLVVYGANINITDPLKGNSLHYLLQSAIQSTVFDPIPVYYVAEKLVELGIDVNQADSDYQTPIELAVYYGEISIVQLLIRHGANPTIRAIESAKESDRTYLLRILLNVKTSP